MNRTIVVERGINEENGIRDFLATCELDIVLVYTKVCPQISQKTLV